MTGESQASSQPISLLVLTHSGLFLWSLWGALAGLWFWARSAILHRGAPSAPLSSPKSATLKVYSQAFMFYSVLNFGGNFTVKWAEEEVWGDSGAADCLRASLWEYWHRQHLSVVRNLLP